ncbi:uncharacterized protein TRIADDRAFT_61238 [Trichoplax adhaerens]|uniref:Cytochrome b5 heme-binding domain-containing protein n=1 Tax=Trichoplax adhaerens TaxID=10228 RepID=B3SAF2_TRIAD|nr:hypothetical protein TRIADDRAFT_61238 [Trichoplax adhaerens]EDV20248.1 hypothetical protein TRIADDRAFT_61238 [Trichoplax adhaerens]|eukprot:XP_002117198.1 hypothetical protein TRIADDRAFT_61238 [Trichoplax adhaerens]
MTAKSGHDYRYWYLNGIPYDFKDFLKNHPGGIKAIMLGRGRDCTAMFESYHTFRPADALLEKYKVKNGKVVEGSFFTFEPDGFYMTVKERARQYFKKNKINHTKADYLVGAFTLLEVIATYAFMLLTFMTGNWIYAALWGFGRAMCIIGPTHAGSHYAFSRSPFINKAIYIVSMAISGSTPAQWTSKHVIAHHVDTNIVPVDDDTMYPLKRVLPAHKRLAFHHLQHIYIWFLYPFTLSFWSISNAIKLFADPPIEGVTQVIYLNKLDILETWIVLAFHLAQRFVLFFVFFPFSEAIKLYLVSEMIASTWFSLQFAVNHEVDGVVDHTPNKKVDWGKHQVITSHNYGSDSYLALYLSGGLNTQIEHHLFPSVHYHHYKELSKIVRRTCKEFNIKYIASSNFYEALKAHYRHLRRMGQPIEAA